jgi:hypothetical protein
MSGLGADFIAIHVFLISMLIAVRKCAVEMAVYCHTAGIQLKTLVDEMRGNDALGQIEHCRTVDVSMAVRVPSEAMKQEGVTNANES